MLSRLDIVRVENVVLTQEVPGFEPGKTVCGAKINAVEEKYYYYHQVFKETVELKLILCPSGSST